MKHKTSLIVLLIALAVLALACGPCGAIGSITEGDGDQDSPAATRPPSDKPDEPPPPGGAMKNVPIYPGATAVTGVAPPPVPGATGDYEDVEVGLYETGDDQDKVCDFYESEMPKAGWEKVIFMTTDEGCITSWLSGDGKIGATVVVAEQSDGKVFISIVAGRTE